jgi:hypothetical protein
MTHDDDLRDLELTRLLRNDLGEDTAPPSWVQDALAVPDRTALDAPPEPWLVVLAPHLGALFLIGGAVWAVCQPATRDLLVSHVPRFDGQYGPFLILAGLLTPLLLVFCDRGFRRFRL